MLQIQNLKTKMSQKLINSSQLLLQQRIWTNSFIQAKQLKSSIFQHVHHSRSRQLIFLFAPSVVFANKRLLVASESSMLLPTALAQTFKDSLLQNSKGNSALINGPSPSWHSLPILFQTNSFVGIKSRTKTRSCWTRPGNCPTSHPKNLARTSIIVFRRT